MKTSEIYSKTMKFVWLKLALGVGLTVACGLIITICLLLGSIGNGDAMGVFIFIAAFLCIGLYKVVDYYIGYLLKAAHIAVIAEAATSGQVPEDMFNVGKEKVKERFGATNVYFAIDRLITGAVSQIQKVVGKVGDLLANVPGMDTIVNLVQMFIGIFLGYIDECCLGYTFLHKDENAFKAGCDGVAIYFQNAKCLMKSAIKTTLIVVVASTVAFFVPFFIFMAIFAKLGTVIAVLIALILAASIAAAIRSSFIDSYILVDTMNSFMQVAPSTEINVDIYGKLCNMSSKFKKMFQQSGMNNANI